MEMTNKNKIIMSAVAIVVLVALYIAFDKRSKEEEVVINNNENTATSTLTQTLPSGVKYTIVPLGESDNVPQPMPNLDRVLVKSTFAVNVSQEEIASASPKIKEIQTFLKTNPSVFVAWVDLGAYQKSAGDYDGAVISWEYASKLAPKEFVAFGNIGNLYGLYFKNMAMSDLYYRKAISRAPDESYLYAQLAEIYQYTGKNISKAKAVLNEGLKAIPNDPNLTFLLSELE